MRQSALGDFIFLRRRFLQRRGRRRDLTEVYLEPQRRKAQMLERGPDFFLAQIELELLRRGDLQFAVDQRSFRLRNGIGGEVRTVRNLKEPWNE